MANVTVPFTPQNAVKINATSTASTALALPVFGSTLNISNAGPNLVYVALLDEPASLAAVPGATFGTQASLMVPVNGSININRGTMRFVSTICEATQTALVIVSSGDGGV